MGKRRELIYAGIDAGSRAVKIVLLRAGGRRPLARACVDQGVEQARLTGELFDRMLGEHELTRGQVGRVVATGYGRNQIEFADTTITELTCHARGVRHLVRQARTVIEIGGQDSKLLRLDEHGAVRDFAMNDRCAAGTGRFLEMAAQRLGVPLDKLGALAGRSRAPAAISSMCAVFAETEIVGLLAGGTGREDIIAGVENAIAARLAAMAGKGLTPPIVFTGGVALVSGMDQALARTLGRPVKVAPMPQFTGALGAALLAMEGT